MYPCWNRIPQRRGEWMIQSWISSSRLATIRSTRLMAFETARSMPGSQQDSYQGSTIWSCEKATLRRRIPGSLHWQSSIFKSSSPPITKTTQRSRQRHPYLLIQPHRRLDPPLYQCLGLRRRQQRNVIDLLSPPALPLSKQRSPRSLSCLTPPDFPL